MPQDAQRVISSIPISALCKNHQNICFLANFVYFKKSGQNSNLSKSEMVKVALISLQFDEFFDKKILFCFLPNFKKRGNSHLSTFRNDKKNLSKFVYILAKDHRSIFNLMKFCFSANFVRKKAPKFKIVI